MVMVGAVLLVHQMGLPLPRQVFNFNTLLMGIGLLIGIKSRFRQAAWLILLLIGIFLSLDDWFPLLHVRQYSTAAIVILIGLVFLFFRPRHRYDSDHEEWKRQLKQSIHEAKNSWRTEAQPADGEYLDSVVIFGGIEKKIVSKNFQGGEITCFMGGAEIDFSQADIQGPVVLVVTQVFGGTKIVVPPHWNIKSEIVAVFAGMEDKRPANGLAVDPNKTIVLRGTSVFGGIEVNSY